MKAIPNPQINLNDRTRVFTMSKENTRIMVRRKDREGVINPRN